MKKEAEELKSKIDYTLLSDLILFTKHYDCCIDIFDRVTDGYPLHIYAVTDVNTLLVLNNLINYHYNRLRANSDSLDLVNNFAVPCSGCNYTYEAEIYLSLYKGEVSYDYY